MTNPLLPLFGTRYLPAWPGREDSPEVPYEPLDRLLTRNYTTDVHFAAYSVTKVPKRLDKGAVGHAELTEGVQLVLVVVDIDDAQAHADGTGARPEWRELERAKVERLFQEHPGGFYYETKNGYRLVYRLGEPFLLRSDVDAIRWRLFYFRVLCLLAKHYEIIGDPTCADWTRLYRLPHATREGNDTAEQRPTVGAPSNVGVLTYQPTPNGLLSAREVAARLVSTFPAWERVVKDLAPKEEPPKSDPQPRPKTTNGSPDPDGLSPFQRGALDSAVQKVRNCPPGGRNDLLNQEVYSLAGLDIDRALLEAELGAAARVAGLGETEIRATFSSAFKAGAAQPRTIEPPRSTHKAPSTQGREEGNGLPALDVAPVAPKAKILPRTYEEFMALVPTPQESICGEWFPTSALVMVSGDSGVGKTWFCLDLALSVSCGVPFMTRWPVPKARKVLLVSGEDRLQDLQKRLPDLLKAKNKAAGKKLAPQICFLAARDRALLPKGIPNLGTPEGRALVEDGLEGVELVILDNYSVLFNGVDENDAKEFAPIQDWLFSLSARGVAVLLVAHTGKSGDHRGSSKKVDGLNASILLNHSSTWKAREGASFELKFKKSRDAHGAEVDSFAAKLGPDEHGDLCWLFDEVPPTVQASAKPAPKTAAILKLHAQGKTLKEIYAAGFKKSMVSRVLSAFREASPKLGGGSSFTGLPSTTPYGVVVDTVNSKQATKSPGSTPSTVFTESMIVNTVNSKQATKSPGSTPFTEVNAQKATLPVTPQPDPERDCSKTLYPPSNPNAKTATPTKGVTKRNPLLAELREDYHCEAWLDDRGEPRFEYQDGYTPKQREVDFLFSHRAEIVAALQEEQGTNKGRTEERKGVSL